MTVLEEFHFNDILHAISQSLIIPTVILLVLLAAYAVYTLGSLIVEVRVERRYYKVAMPKLISDLVESNRADMPAIVEASGLLRTQKDALLELIDYMHLPEDALSEVARKLLSNESERYQKALSTTESAVKIAPMLGLMGTLIPLGPGIMALSTGDLETLSASLLVAFDTTIAGLTVAVICFLVTKTRRRWYSAYLISIEGAMNTILEKAEFLRAQDAAEGATSGATAIKGDHAADDALAIPEDGVMSNG